MKTRLVINGKFADNVQLREIIERYRMNHQFDVRVSWDKGDIAEFAAEASKYRRIIVFGGDGSLNEAVSGIMDSGSTAELAAVPLGTANDFSVQAGLPLDLEKSVQYAFNGSSRSVDLIQINSHYCLNGISIGRAARVTQNTPELLKSVVGKYAYSLTSLVSFFDTASPVVFRDDNCEYIFGYVLNSKACGGGFEVAPNSKINDGKFEVLLIKKFDLTNIANVTYDLWQDNENEYIKRMTADCLYLESKEALPLSIDGELTYLSNKLYLKCISDRLKAVIPEDSDIISKSVPRKAG